jgi:hypothetical protein
VLTTTVMFCRFAAVTDDAIRRPSYQSAASGDDKDWPKNEPAARRGAGD